MSKVTPLKRRYGTPALEKGLDILELFAREPLGLTKSEVARRLNRTVSEIFRMLLCLEERGYVARVSGDDRFRLTLQMFKMAQEYPPTKRLAAEALPLMQKVAHDLNQSCHLGVLDGGRVVILAQVDAPESPGFSVKAGSVVDLMHASTGHVILSHLPAEIRERAISIWQEQTGNKRPRDLDKHLELIKQRGFEQRRSYQIKGVLNISYPVVDTWGNAVAALNVPFLPRIDDQTNAKAVNASLREASRKLSEEIGGHV
jgi:DNA-binding IclR family transcriptional regulator